MQFGNTKTQPRADEPTHGRAPGRPPRLGRALRRFAHPRSQLEIHGPPVRPYFGGLDRRSRIPGGTVQACPFRGRNRLARAVDRIRSGGTGHGGGRPSSAGYDPELGRGPSHRKHRRARTEEGDHSVYAHIASGSQAQTFVSEFYRGIPHRSGLSNGTASVEIKSVLPSSDRTLEVEWMETTRDLYGSVKTQERWKGAFTLAVTPPTEERVARINPLGLYVTNASWTRVL